MQQAGWRNHPVLPLEMRYPKHEIQNRAAFRISCFGFRNSLLTAPRGCAASVAFAAGAAADESQLAAFDAWIAFVALEAGNANLTLERGLGDGESGTVLVAVARATAVVYGAQVFAARREEGLSHRLGFGGYFCG